MTIRNLEDKTMVDNKTSDFSIEHILNRAGTSITNDKEMLTLDEFERNYTFPYNSDQFLEESYLHCTPPWLSYSRYHPPPQTRPLKGPVKRTPGRLPRVPFTPYQLRELESSYKQTTYLSSEAANVLANKLDLMCSRVKIWFQNRRARERRENREREKLSNSPSSSPQYCNTESGYSKIM